jgi:hypothetical protein
MRGSPTNAAISEMWLLSLLLSHASRRWPRIKVVIRLHPSEAPDKYGRLLARYPKGLYRLSSKRDILADLASAFLVVGLESMALVIAGICGKMVLRFPSREKEKRISHLPVPGEIVNGRDAFTDRINHHVQQHLQRSGMVGTCQTRHSGR